MQHGILSSNERSAIPLMHITEQVVGEPAHRNERLFFSSPADPIDSELLTLYHEKNVESFLEDMGYDVEPINEGKVVIYSELADQNFTGLGISFGAGMTNVCLSNYAVPVMTFSVARGGDWIDEQAAQATGTPVDKVTSIKEDDFKLDFRTDIGSVEGALAIYYESLLDYVIEHISREVNEEGLDVPVIVTGGTSSPRGFEKLFEDHLEDADIPFSVSGVQQASEPLYSVARGALVDARSDEGEQAPSTEAAATDGGESDETDDANEAEAEK